MGGEDLFVLAVMLVFSGGMAFFALVGAGRVASRHRGLGASVFNDDPSPTVFLFEDETLVDATPGARQLLDLTQRDGSAWRRLVQALLPRFPSLPEVMATLADQGTVAVASADGQSRIEAEWRHGLARLTLIDRARQESSVAIDKLTLDALEGELVTLRGVAEEVPYLTWKESPDGQIVWANAAYLAAADRMTPGAVLPVWPPRALFPAYVPGVATGRVAIDFPGTPDQGWFDLGDRPLADGVLRVALSADAAVGAERSRAEFVQTLTKTFSTLTAGLAIFDRKRRLVLFNPALADLTGLPVEFLIQRPGLAAFLDRLRETRILPEPKNFLSWRQRLSTLESEAERGTFSETWAQPDGQVFEVNGRPHPDGAIAFLIKDVSAEIRLTRQFRDELALNQAVLDSLDDAVAVFGADGGLVLSNAAYGRMWDLDTGLGLHQVTLTAAMRQWRTNCPTSPDWSRVPTFGAGALSFEAERLTGQRLDCRFRSLPGGALMARFSAEGEPRSLSFRQGFRPDVCRV